jgi:hypothetical protein
MDRHTGDLLVWRDFQDQAWDPVARTCYSAGFNKFRMDPYDINKRFLRGQNH